VKAECAVLSVPENYAEPNGKTIDLHIARFKSRNNKASSHATTLLAGGPGQGAIESFAPLILRLRDVNLNQDIYLIDQRGTGQSNKMQCNFSEEEVINAGNDFNPELTLKLTQECLDDLPGDPRYYTSSVAIQDLDLIRQKLEIEKWNLYGGSYGTRTAQHYLKQHPEHTRSVILDGLVSPDLPLGPEISTESQKSLDELLLRCKNDTDCNTAFPSLTADTNKLIAELKRAPKEVTIENLASGKLESMEFTQSHLAGGIRLSLYSPFTMSILPNLINEAANNGHYGPLARLAINNTRRLTNSISMGMHNSVVCTEDAPVIENVKVDQALLDRSYMGDDFQPFIETTCSIWPRGPIDDGFHDLVTTDIPVLLLSGSQDPVTPPEYAERAMQNMKTSKHIVIQGQGHIQLSLGCMPTLAAQFIEAASFDDIEFNCLEKIKPEPFFIDFNGPTP